MSLRQQIRAHGLFDDSAALKELLHQYPCDPSLRKAIHLRAVELVERIREDSDPSMMELFLAEFGLSSDEGIALMCLAEALLRVPDFDTIDALIEDKIRPSEWGQHLGQSHSSLINASTWALFMTGKVLDDEHESKVSRALHGVVKRLGEPIIRQAVSRVMKELGDQFVLGETIDSALSRAEELEQQGFTHSYDMLGEAARTETEAKNYHIAYGEAITAIAKKAKSSDIRENPGISIKLSALHPRYELLQKEAVMTQLMPRARSLAVMAKSANIGLNIDAEEADRLDISLDIIEAILADPVLQGWEGFGVVVQAYNKRAPLVLDWLYELAQKLDRRIMVRLVKGAYWDSEIKAAQTHGLEGFPVFTRKPSTDVSYICCARKLLQMSDRIYPQFATHSAHSAAAILELAPDKQTFEFQRLHGMGEALHSTVHRRQGTRCRIYAPVGRHKDLLAYLVRRLLENGANSSFVSQIVDENVSPAEVVADPFATVETYLHNAHHPRIKLPRDLYAPRVNARGWDLGDPAQVQELAAALATAHKQRYTFTTLSGERQFVLSPTSDEELGTLCVAAPGDVAHALAHVRAWGAAPKARAECLRRAADLFQQHADELFSLLMREAGKTLGDCIAELREAVDFLRYYAEQGEQLRAPAAGVVSCVSPWNFPLAIFTGQLAAALAAGNGVLAKPAEATPLIAHRAVQLLHEAGVPAASLWLLPGEGAVVGAALTADARVNGVCFTGSTSTAQRIHQNMAQHLAPHARLIAETGGQNAMMVDSTALPQQVVRDVLASAFQSSGQRCSALRVLYLQDDIADALLEMLLAAMDELVLGSPQDFATDIGPVIDRTSQQKLNDYISQAAKQRRLLKQLPAPDHGCFVGPAVIAINSIAELHEEMFGPVLHIARFAAEDFSSVIRAINATGYGLTFALHSRIDDRVQQVVTDVMAGNIYINRNQIGAIVESQPFGGQGLSGTGPKAGGPHYLPAFTAPERGEPPANPPVINEAGDERMLTAADVEQAFAEITEAQAVEQNAMDMPGPTGESNRLSRYPLDYVLCLGPGEVLAEQQAELARAVGCKALPVAPQANSGCNGRLPWQALADIKRLDAVLYWGYGEEQEYGEANDEDARAIRTALAQRPGAIVPLIMERRPQARLQHEKHICIDTTAAGGNAALLAAE